MQTKISDVFSIKANLQCLDYNPRKQPYVKLVQPQVFIYNLYAIMFILYSKHIILFLLSFSPELGE